MMNSFGKKEVKKYIKTLRKKGYSIALIKSKLESVRLFLTWQEKQGKDVKEAIKEVEKQIKKLKPSLLKRLLRKISNTKLFIAKPSKETFPFNYIGLALLLLFSAFLGAGIYNRFFKKVQRPFAYPLQPVRAGRVISFQGRLTDSLGNPITTKTDVVFKLYNVPTGGTPLYTGSCTGVNGITPDQDGIFNVLIGQDCGMSEIPANIFTENANVYLGITVGTDSEMTPRQQIANVGYAMNAETLQGLPPDTGETATSFIPFINQDGDMLLAVASPGIRSTYTSANFELSSANAFTITSAGTGDIVLQATESGTLKFRTGGSTDTYTRMMIDSLGKVGIGTITPSYTLDVSGTGRFSSTLYADGGISTTTGGLSLDSFSGTTTVNDNLSVTGTLDVTGATTLSSTLTVSGSTNIDSGTLLVDSTTNRVGIGTTSPTYPLEVTGDIKAQTIWLTGGELTPPIRIPKGNVYTTENLYPHTGVLTNWFGEDLLAFNPPYKVERWDPSTSSWIDVTSNADWKKVTSRTGSTVSEPGITGKQKYRFYFDIGYNTAINGQFIMRGHYNLNKVFEVTLEASSDSTFATGNTTIHSSTWTSGIIADRGFLVASTDTNVFNRYLRITVEGQSYNPTSNPPTFVDFYFVRAGGQGPRGNKFLVPIYWDDDLNLQILADGSATTPAISWNNDTNTGIFRPAADVIALSTTGSERLRIDSSGNVGIGTTSPSGKLHVVGGDVLIGTGTFDNPSASEDLYVTGNLEVDGTIYGNVAGTIDPNFTPGSVVFAGASGELAQDNANFFWDDTNDKLGIGTNSPVGKLHVTGTVTGKALAIFNETGDQNILVASASGQTKFVITNAGNVGIGTASPGTKLEIQDSSTTGPTMIIDTALAPSTWGSADWQIFKRNGTEALKIQIYNNSGYFEPKFYVSGGNPQGTPLIIGNQYGMIRILPWNPDNSLYFQSSMQNFEFSAWNGGQGQLLKFDFANTYFSGKVGVGTTSPTSLLHITGAVTGKALAIFNETGDQNILVASASGQTKFVITNAGNVGIGTTSPGGTLEVAHNTDVTKDLFKVSYSGSDKVTVKYDANSNYHFLEVFNNTLARFGTSWATADWPNRTAYVKGHSSNAVPFTILSYNSTPTNDLFQVYGNGEVFEIDASGNVGIGTTSPIGKLHVEGAVTGKALAIFNETGDQNILVASASGQTKFVITNAGNVGIGTATPVSTLHVSGNKVTLDVTNTLEGLLINNATQPSIRLNETSGGHEGNIRFNTTNGLLLSTDSYLYPITIDGSKILLQTNSSGNVGIGTTNPQELLHVGAGTDASSLAATKLIVTESGNTALSVRDSTNDVETFIGSYLSLGGGIIGTATNHGLRIRTNNTDRITITNIGDVGIGTTSPSEKLHVVGGDVLIGTGTFDNPSSSEDLYVTGNLEVDGTIYGNVAGTIDPNFTPGSVVFAGASGELAQDNANFFWDDTNDKLGIGTNSPVGKLHVTGAVTGKALAIFNETGDQNILVASASGQTKFVITNTGNVGIGTTAPNDKLDIKGGSLRLTFTGSGDERKILFVPTGQHTSSNLAIGTIGMRAAGDIADRAKIQFVQLWDGAYTDYEIRFFVTDGGVTTRQAMTINKDGNIGIGTTSPSYKLDVVGTGKFSSTLYADGGISTTTGGLSLDSFSGTTTVNDNLSVTGTLDVTGATTLSSTLTVSGDTNIDSGTLFVDSTNNRVGIGTTTPGYELDVTGWLASSYQLVTKDPIFVEDFDVDNSAQWTNTNTSVLSVTWDTANSRLILTNPSASTNQYAVYRYDGKKFTWNDVQIIYDVEYPASGVWGGPTLTASTNEGYIDVNTQRTGVRDWPAGNRVVFPTLGGGYGNSIGTGRHKVVINIFGGSYVEIWVDGSLYWAGYDNDDSLRQGIFNFGIVSPYIAGATFYVYKIEIRPLASKAPTIEAQSGLFSPASTYLATLTGNVGIGTTSPSYKLDVSGTGRFTGNLTLSSVPLLSDNNKVLTVDASGVVSYIDTSSWDKNASDDVTTFLGLTDTPSSYTGYGGYVVKVRSDETGLEFVASSAVSPWTESLGVVYVDNTANKVSIGDTTTVHKLEVEGAITGKALVSFWEKGDQDILVASSGATTPSNVFRITNNGSIVSQGDITASSGTITGATLTDGTASISGGNITGVGNLTMSGTLTANGTIDTALSTGVVHADSTGILSSVLGTANYIPKWTSTGLSTTSNIYDDGTNVGIGTTSPGAKLDVAGTIRVPNSTSIIFGTTYSYYIHNYANSDSLWIHTDNRSITRLVLGTDFNWDKQVSFIYTPGTVGAASGILKIGQFNKNATGWTHGITSFYTQGSERMRIDASGNVGIGTTSPSGKLHVVGGDVLIGTGTFDNPSASEDLYVTGNLEVDGTIYGNVAGTIDPNFTPGSVVFAGASGELAQDNANFFWDDTNDKLGIGTNSPIGKLHVTGAVTGKALAIFNETGDQNILVASASGQTKFVITNAGNVGIGTTSPSYTLDVSGDTNIASGTLFVDSTTNRVGIGTTTPGYELDVTGWLASSYQLVTKDPIFVEDFDVDNSAQWTNTNSSVLSVTWDTANSRLILTNPSASTSQYAVYRYDGKKFTWNDVQIIYDVEYPASGVWGGPTLTASTNEGYIDVNTQRTGVRDWPAGNRVVFPTLGGGYGNSIGTGRHKVVINIFGGSYVEIWVDGSLYWAGYDNDDSLRQGIFNFGIVSPYIAGATFYVYKIEIRPLASKAPTIEAQSGLFSPASTYLATLTGNVGIGTNSPVGKLHVTGAVTGKALAIFNETGDQNILVASASGQTKFVITNAGDVGVGTANPLAKLHIDSGNGDSFMIFGQASESSYWSVGLVDYNPVQEAFIISRGSTLQANPFLTILSSGNVGIGTTNPSKKLHIYDSTTNNILHLQSGNAAVGLLLQDDTQTLSISQVAGRLSIDTTNDGTYEFVITSTGNVGIGTTNPSKKLHVEGDAKINGSILGFSDSVLNDTSGVGLIIKRQQTLTADSQTLGYLNFQINSTGFTSNAWRTTLTSRMTINASGDISTGGTFGGIGVTMATAGTGNISAGSVHGVGVGLRNDGTGTLSNFSYFRVFAPTGTGPITNLYGLYIENLTQGTNNWAIYTAGTTKSYFGGNVGIGTTSPSGKLHVVGGDVLIGTGTFDNPSASEDLYVTGNLEVDGTIYGNVAGTIDPNFTPGSVVFAGASGELAQDNANFFWDDTNDKLGIGTNSPVGKLHVTGAVTGKALAIFNETGDQNILVASASGQTKFVITNAGNVGIGVTSPLAKLNIVGDSTVQNVLRVQQTNAINAAVVGILADNVAMTAPALYVRQKGTGDIAQFVDDTNIVVSIKDGGNVGIGTTSPINKLDVAGGVAIGSSYAGTNTAPSNGLIVEGNVGIGIANPTAGLHLAGTPGTTGIKIRKGGYDVTIGNTNAGGSYGGLVIDTYSTPNAFIITNSGNVGIGTTSPIGKLHVEGAVTGKALAIFNETGDQNILVASASGQTKFVITNAGSVGIGVTSPSYKLDVSGTGRFTGDLTLESLLSPSGGIADNNKVLTVDASGVVSYIDTTNWDKDSSDDITSFTLAADSGTPETINNGDTLTIKGGNGLSSTVSSPDTVTLNVGAGSGITVGADTVSLGGALTGNTGIDLAGYSFTLYGSGSVGIGTTSPQEKLTLGASSNFAIEMSTPTGVSATATTGGTLTAGTYYIKIVASDGVGTTIGSTETSCTVDGTTTNACSVSWSAVTGASSYRVYVGTTSNGQDRYWTTSSTSYTVTAYGTGDGSIAGTVPTVVTAYVTKFSSSGNSWILGGNVGIGTANPNSGYILDVRGNQAVGSTSDGNYPGVFFDYIDGGTGEFRFRGFRWGEIFKWGHQASGYTWVPQMELNNNVLKLYNSVSSPGSVTVQIHPAGYTYFNGGNVGIGITSPSTSLAVSGSISVGGNDTSSAIQPYIKFANADEINAGTITYKNWDTGAFEIVGAGAAAGSRRVRIYDSLSIGYSSAPSNGIAISGNMGIGTTNPNEKLEIKGDLLVRNPQNNSAIFISPSSAGYGVDPELVIQAAETGAGSDAPFHISRNAFFTTSNDTYQYIDDGGQEATKMEFTYTGDIKFSYAPAGTGTITWTDIMTIKGSSGNVGIGTTNPGTAKLAVYGDGTNTTETLTINQPTAYWKAIKLTGDANIYAVDVTSISHFRVLMQNNAASQFGFTANGSGDSWEFRCTGTGACYADGGWNGAADFAEMIKVKEPKNEYKFGEIVSIENNSKRIAHKSSIPYDPTLIGVISSNPGFVGDYVNPDKLIDNPDRIGFNDLPVGIVGIVNTQVSTINGTIKSGDPITSSYIPGIGMKADNPGIIVGKALESTQHWNQNNCPTIQNLEDINWPKDDPENSKKPCFKIQVASLSPQTQSLLKKHYSLKPSDYIYVGKILTYVKVSWYDPDVYLTNTGDLSIEGDQVQVAANNISSQTLSNLFTNATYKLIKSGKETIERIGAFSEIAVAKLKAGIIKASDVLVENTLLAKNIIVEKASFTTEEITIAGKKLSQYIDERIEAFLQNRNIAINNNTFISPVIHTQNLEAENLTVKQATVEGKLAAKQIETEQITADSVEIKASSRSGKLAQLIIKNFDGKDVTIIDSEGNASFSGTLSASQINTKQASIEGKLVAKQVQAENITTMEQQIQNLQQKLQEITTSNSQNVEQASSSADINKVQQLLADLSQQPLPDVTYYQKLDPQILSSIDQTSTSSSILNDSLNLYSLTVASSINVGQMIIENNSILALSWELKLSALEKITFFDGTVTIAKDGTITTEGQIIAKGGIRTTKLKIENPLGNEVAHIDASGSAYFKELTLDKYLEATQPAAVITAAENFAQNGIFAPAIKTNGEVAGIGRIPAAELEVIIYNEKVHKNSLIYVTPTTPGFEGTLNVVEKGEGFFKVQTNTPFAKDILFDWLIVN